MNVVVPEPRRAPSMRAFRFLRDSRSSGLFNPVSLCRAISQRLPGTGIKKNDRSGRSIATRISAWPEKQSCGREKRNSVPSRNVFGHDRPKSSEGGIVLYLDRFAIFRARWRPARACRCLSRRDCRVDPERGDFIRCPTCVSGCLDSHRSRRLSAVGLSSSLLGFRDPDLDRSCRRPVRELLA